MKPKTVVTIVLLMFVAGSVVYLVAKEAFEGAPQEGGSDESLAAGRAAVPAAPSSGPAPKMRTVTAYYFYGNFRCANCRRIEAWTHNALVAGFAGDLRQGRLAWKPVNVDQPGNEHFIRDFKLYTRSVVLAEFEDGRQIRYKNLQKVWQLLGNRTAFERYVEEEARAFLKR